jgi:MYXO-CTERM domain-containing protein
MKTYLKHFAIVCCLFGAVLKLHSQESLVPNGVVSNFDGLFFAGEIDVLHNPANPTSGGSYTGFQLNPVNANTFQFDPVVDIGVRVFFVSPNDPITASAILSESYAELTYPNSYVFDAGSPVYVGLYTGNQSFAPPNGIYTDPLFGWAELENVGGTIELLDSALEYQGGGIYAGKQTIIPAPEPSKFALGALGALLFGFRRRKRSS